MNLKISLLSAITLFSTANAFAQDKIYTRDGDVMEVKVKVVGEKNVTYKKVDDNDGPSYIINKKEIERIQYESGDEDIMVAERRGPGHPGRPERFDKPAKKARPDYGNNIIAVSPLQLTERGAGFGLSYECVLDKKRNIVSFYMPMAMSFDFGNNTRYDYYGNYYGNNNDNRDYSWYVMPGIKFYPTGGKGIVKYAVGPNLVFRQTHYNEYYYYDLYNSQYPGYAPYPYSTERNEFTFGMVINNSLNINPTKHLHMGLEFGLGFSYVTSDNSRYNYNYNNEPEALVQFGFKIGYRF
jgi:hypothetical protein